MHVWHDIGSGSGSFDSEELGRSISFYTQKCITKKSMHRIDFPSAKSAIELID